MQMVQYQFKKYKNLAKNDKISAIRGKKYAKAKR